MSKISRFALGGLGGLLPILATLVAVDLSSIAMLIDNHAITTGLCVGYTIRVVGLFALGGVMAAINSEVATPISLVQIGIAAPALVTSYLAGAEIVKNRPANTASIISAAYAETPMPKKEFVVAGGFFADIITGITPGLGGSGSLDSAHKQIGRPLDRLINVPYRVTTVASGVCLDVPAEKVKTIEAYADLAANYPPPTFLLERGQCK